MPDQYTSSGDLRMLICDDCGGQFAGTNADIVDGFPLCSHCKDPNA